jgi:hypothetical protein
MKKLALAIATFLIVSLSSKAQYNKDGSPDMRYTANKQTYGTAYNNSSYSQSTYNTPTFKTQSYSIPSTSYTTPKIETYTTPQNTYYPQPRQERQTTIPSFPTTRNGMPDMRYKENRQPYTIRY